MMKLATTNRKTEKIRTFKDILFDPIDRNKSLDNITPTCYPMLPIILPSEKAKQANSICQNIQ